MAQGLCKSLRVKVSRFLRFKALGVYVSRVLKFKGLRAKDCLLQAFRV